MMTWELAGNVILRDALDTDIAELNANMRAMDREECQVLNGKPTEDFRLAERVWALLIDGRVVACSGVGLVMEKDTPLSKVRQMSELSTEEVWKHKLDYVRYTKKACEIMLNELPPWVECICAFPLSCYPESIKWQERFLGFRRDGEVVINGRKHTVMIRTKREVR